MTQVRMVLATLKCFINLQNNSKLIEIFNNFQLTKHFLRINVVNIELVVLQNIEKNKNANSYVGVF